MVQDLEKNLKSMYKYYSVDYWVQTLVLLQVSPQGPCDISNFFPSFLH